MFELTKVHAKYTGIRGTGSGTGSRQLGPEMAIFMLFGHFQRLCFNFKTRLGRLAPRRLNWPLTFDPQQVRSDQRVNRKRRKGTGSDVSTPKMLNFSKFWQILSTFWYIKHFRKVGLARLAGETTFLIPFQARVV